MQTDIGGYFEALSYPKHITERTRIKMAQEVIQHENKKLFASLTEEEFNKVKQDIGNWLTESEEYQFGGGTRDFWNYITAILEGFKLKKGIIRYFTAKNIQWSEEEVAADEIG